MSVPLTIQGVTINYPVQGDGNWGPPMTNWATLVTTALAVLPSTGVITLSPYPIEAINFANATNSGFLALTINGSNQLTFNGTPIGAAATLTNTHIFVGNGSNQPADVALSGDATMANTGAMTIANAAITHAKLANNAVTDTNVDAAAGIQLSKLAPLTASRALASDSSGVIVPSSVTATELSYLSGVTSALQAQLNAIINLVIPIGGSFAYSSATPPTINFVPKDGRAISRTTYSALFALIGTTFGIGDGSTTFNIPNATDRISITAGNLYTLGQTGGAATHTLTQSELSVALGTATSVVTDPTHGHRIAGASNGSGGVGINTAGADVIPGSSNMTTGQGYYNVMNSGRVIIEPSATGITVATTITNSAGGNAHSLLNPFIAEYWMYRII